MPTQKLRYQLFFAALAFFTIGCKKTLERRYYDAQGQELILAENTNELKADRDFSWKTNISINLSLQGSEAAPFTIMTSKGDIIMKAMFLPTQENKYLLVVSPDVAELSVRYKDKEFFLSTLDVNPTINLNE